LNSDAHDVFGEARANAPHHRAQPRQQLRHREGFGDVVVRARIEAADAIGFLAPRRQHDDGNVARLLPAAQTPAHFDARKLRQHPVEQHEVRRLLVGHQDRFLAVLRFQHAIAFAFEIIAQERDEGALVFRDEDRGLQGHVAGRSNLTVVELVTSAFGRSIVRWPPVTM